MARVAHPGTSDLFPTEAMALTPRGRLASRRARGSTRSGTRNIVAMVSRELAVTLRLFGDGAALLGNDVALSQRRRVLVPQTHWQGRGG